jgi:hypothetical protein
MDMLCLMHQGSEYGHLKVNHKVILPVNLARMVGSTFPEVEGWLTELETAGVFSKNDSGCIYSRRMVRDEELRESRASGGKLGGNPALRKVNLPPNLPPTPSSSSSSSSSVQGRQTDSFPKLKDVETECEMRGYPKPEGTAFWNHFEAAGWIDKNGNEIKQWRPKLANWIVSSRNTHINGKTAGPKRTIADDELDELVRRADKL